MPYLGRCVYDLDDYCDAVLEAKRQGLPVKLGLEVDYVGEQQARLAELLEPYPFDYLLGSVHWLDGMAVDMSPGVWEVMTVDEGWQRYIDALCELAVSQTVHVLAHPDLAKIFGRRPDPVLLAELHERAALAAVASGLAVEISTGGLRKPVGELYPDLDFLRAFVRAGAPVTLASDAHEPTWSARTSTRRSRTRRRPAARPSPSSTAASTAGAARMTDFRVGIGIDAHAFGRRSAARARRRRFDHPRGLVGHSDGDVIAHALTDALLEPLGWETSARSSPPTTRLTAAPTRSDCWPTPTRECGRPASSSSTRTAC